MERQRDNRIPSSVHDRLAMESDHALLRFTHQLNQCQSAEDLLQELPATLHSLISANTFTIVRGDCSDLISSVAVDGSRKRSLIPPELFSQPSACVWVHEQQKPLVIPSLHEETRFPDHLEWFCSNGDRSLCILPLSTTLRRLGVICVGRSDENAFLEEDVSFLEIAANYAALALDDRLNFTASENARAQLESEQTKLKLILDLNNSVVSNLELKQLIQAISPSMRRVMQIDAVALVLPSPDNGDLEVHALDFPDSKGLIRPGITVPLDGQVGSVFRTGKAWVGDIGEEKPQFIGYRAALREGFRALCLLPLVRCNRILGVLSVARLREDSFTDRDVEFLLQIAGQVAIAIDNALAYRRISELSDKLAQENLYLEDEIRSELNFEEIV